MRVRLCVDYAWNESTFAALAVAGCLRQLGCEVSLCAAKRPVKAVDARYDEEVCDWDDLRLPPAAHELWFLPAVPPQGACNGIVAARRTLVLTAKACGEQLRNCLPRVGRIICASEASYHATRGLVGNCLPVEAMSWATGLAPQRKPPPPVIRRWAVLLDRSAQAWWSAEWQVALHVSLRACPQLAYDLILPHNEGRRQGWLLRELQAGFPGRVRICRRPEYGTWLRLLREADWAWCAAALPCTGLDVAACLGQGTPVMACRAPPYAEAVADGYNGLLLDALAEVKPEAWGQFPSCLSVSAAVRLLYREADYGRGIYRQSWPEVQQRETTFLAAWRKFLELE